MPYVYRNPQNKVSGLSSHPPTDAVEEFLADNDPEVIGYLNPQPTLNELKETNRSSFMAEGVRRIALQVPDWDSIETIKTVAGLWASHLATNATPAQLKAKDIYLYVRDTVPPKIAAITTEAGLAAIDPIAADPFGDGTLWPI